MKALLRQVSPKDAVGWATYHAIRKSVLWDGGSRFAYRSDHPDETAEGNYAMLFVVSDLPVGAVRIDIKKKRRQVIFRRVAISLPEQRKGYGTLLMGEAEEFARKHGCVTFIANVNPDAVPFFEEMGYAFDPESPQNDPENPRMTKDASSLIQKIKKASKASRVSTALRLPRILWEREEEVGQR